VGEAQDARPRRGRGSGGARSALRRPALDAGDSRALGADALALAGHDRRRPGQHAGVPGLRGARLAGQPLLPGRPLPEGRGCCPEGGERPPGAGRHGGASRGRVRRRGRTARRLPAPRPDVGPARRARDRGVPADVGRERAEVLHARPGCGARLGLRGLDPPRPRRLRGAVPAAHGLHAQPGGDRASVRQRDRASRRLEAGRGHHRRGPRGDGAQGDRPRARAAARGEPDRDRGRPVPGGGACAGGRGARQGDRPGRDVAARGPLGAAGGRRVRAARAGALLGDGVRLARSGPALARGRLPQGDRLPRPDDGMATHPEPGLRGRAAHDRPHARRRRRLRAPAHREEEERAGGLRGGAEAPRVRPGARRARRAQPRPRRGGVHPRAAPLAARGDETPTALPTQTTTATTTTPGTGAVRPGQQTGAAEPPIGPPILPPQPPASGTTPGD
jgi:hypothetical protein